MPIALLKSRRFLDHESLEHSCGKVLQTLFSRDHYHEYQATLVLNIDWMYIETEKASTLHPNYISKLLSFIETNLEIDEDRALALMYLLPLLLKIGLVQLKQAQWVERKKRPLEEECQYDLRFSLFVEFLNLLDRSPQIRQKESLSITAYVIINDFLQLLVHENVYQATKEDLSKSQLQFLENFYQRRIVPRMDTQGFEDVIATMIKNLVYLDYRTVERHLDKILKKYLTVRTCLLSYHISILCPWGIMYVA
jgi:hypothetical protein